MAFVSTNFISLEPKNLLYNAVFVAYLFNFLNVHPGGHSYLHVVYDAGEFISYTALLCHIYLLESGIEFGSGLAKILYH
jgi:hypothetical protein